MPPLHHKSFEEKARQSADGFGMVPSAQVLAAIKQQLHPQKKRRWIVFWWLFVPMALLIISGVYFQNTGKGLLVASSAHKHTSLATTNLAKQRAPQKANVPLPLQHSIASKFVANKTAHQPIAALIIPMKNTFLKTANYTLITLSNAESAAPQVASANPTEPVVSTILTAVAFDTSTFSRADSNVFTSHHLDSAVLSSKGGSTNKKKSKPVVTHSFQAGIGFQPSQVVEYASTSTGIINNNQAGGLTIAGVNFLFEQKTLIAAHLGWQVSLPVTGTLRLATGTHIQYSKIQQTFTPVSGAIAGQPIFPAGYSGSKTWWHLQVPLVLQYQHRYAFVNRFRPLAGVMNHVLLSSKETGFTTESSLPPWQVLGVLGVDYRVGAKGRPWSLQYQWRTAPLWGGAALAPAQTSSHHILISIPIQKK